MITYCILPELLLRAGIIELGGKLMMLPQLVPMEPPAFN